MRVFLQVKVEVGKLFPRPSFTHKILIVTPPNLQQLLYRYLAQTCATLCPHDSEFCHVCETLENLVLAFFGGNCPYLRRAQIHLRLRPFCLYRLYFQTRKFSWVMTREVVWTLSRKLSSIPLAGWFSRMNARMASANCFDLVVSDCAVTY